MNDLNDMEQDNNRAGPSHDSTQHPGKSTILFIITIVYYYNFWFYRSGIQGLSQLDNTNCNDVRLNLRIAKLRAASKSMENIHTADNYILYEISCSAESQRQ